MEPSRVPHLLAKRSYLLELERGEGSLRGEMFSDSLAEGTECGTETGEAKRTFLRNLFCERAE